MDWRPVIDGLVWDCLCPLNGLTRIVYMTEGHLLNAPSLMLKCYRINWRQWKSCKIDYPPFPPNRKWFKASISPKQHIRATPLIPRPFRGQTEGDTSNALNASVAPTWARRRPRIDCIQWAREYLYTTTGSGRANRKIKERSISLANDSLRTASGSNVSFKLSSPQTTDWVMKQWRHVSGFHRV